MRFLFLSLFCLLCFSPAFAEESAPEIPGAQSIQGSSGVVEMGVIYPDRAQGLLLPDLSLEALPSEAVSVRFLVEHRTALHEKKVAVRGVVVSVLIGEDACPSSGGMCAQPRLTIAESGEDSGDARYDLVVLFPEGAGEGYSVGENAEISGTVSASPQAVVMRAE
jgi:hypothetical protein